jgi:hypothetical protein
MSAQRPPLSVRLKVDKICKLLARHDAIDAMPRAEIIEVVEQFGKDLPATILFVLIYLARSKRMFDFAEWSGFVQEGRLDAARGAVGSLIDRIDRAFGDSGDPAEAQELLKELTATVSRPPQGAA